MLGCMMQTQRGLIHYARKFQEQGVETPIPRVFPMLVISAITFKIVKDSPFERCVSEFKNPKCMDEWYDRLPDSTC